MIAARRKRARPRRLSAGGVFSAGAVGGGLAAYFFDPAGGRRRRHLARDRTAGMLRRGARSSARAVRTRAAVMLGHSRGLVHRLRPLGPEPLDDVELAHKVESILFRDPAVPKGRLNINAEKGTIFLRGQVDSPELVSELEHRVREIAGVHDVENLLHLPGTRAPASHGRTKAPEAEREG
ncbi:MAG TPA: BON domain-containing protein [Gaiellaceae bacterium]|nr:BON domain-containing protein [Gaiellaceae bacterium]